MLFHSWSPQYQRLAKTVVLGCYDQIWRIVYHVVDRSSSHISRSALTVASITAHHSLTGPVGGLVAAVGSHCVTSDWMSSSVNDSHHANSGKKH